MKKTLGLDESGNDHLGKVDPDYPVFVVGGVILEDEYIPTASEAVNAFKRDLFGRDDFVLHTAEFTRGRGAFTRVQEPSFREQFYEQLYRMMRALEFSVIACVFDLNRYASHPQAAAPSLYSLALPRLTNQFCDIIGNRYHGGRIRVEKGRREQDRAIARCWDELRDSGTPQTSAQTIRNRIEFLRPHTKKERRVELELADFVLTPIGRHFAGYPDESEWDIVREKFHGGADSAVTIFSEQE